MKNPPAPQDPQVRYEYGKVMIKFPEPVVPASVCRNRYNWEASDADKGLDLFEITGDDSHVPEAVWRDQDLLCIKFAEGTSCATEYKLAFRPGCGKYLSQAPMSVTSFPFRHPKVRLDAHGVRGLEPGSAVVSPDEVDTLEAREFSVHSAVTYSYRKFVKESYLDAEGATRRREVVADTIPALVEPACIKHDMGDESMERLAATHPDWAALTPDSPLPQAVLVRPLSPLQKGGRWELWCDGGDCFAEESLESFRKVDPGMSSHARAGYEGDEEELQIEVGFDAELTAEEARRAWLGTKVFCQGREFAASADGTAKSLEVNGEECRVSLQDLVKVSPACDLDDFEPEEEMVDLDGPVPVEYVPQGLVTGFTLKVEGRTPMVLEVEIPAGVSSALGGRRTEAPRRHRLVLNPAWPDIGEASGPCSRDHSVGMRSWPGEQDWPGMVVLPLKGGHKLRVPLLNMDALTAVAYRVPAEMLLNGELERFFTNTKGDPDAAREAVKCKTALEGHARKANKLSEDDLRYVSDKLESWRAGGRSLSGRMPRGLKPVAPYQEVEVPAGDDTNLASVEAVVDMDALLGGEAAPGIYLVRLKSRANASVRQALGEIRLPEDTLDSTRCVLVQITDLNITYTEDVMLVTRLSDGSPVEDVRLTPYTAQPKRRAGETMVRQGGPVAAPGGCMTMEKLLGKGNGRYAVIVECGDDYTLFQQGYGMWSAWTPSVEQRVFLQTDRALYRPGETVHVRGVLRCVDHQGKASLPGVKTVDLRVSRLLGKDILRKQVAVDASGGIDESFTLPEEGEDVAGTYSISVSSGGYKESVNVRCAVFRRDSFKLDSRLEVDAIAPKEFTLTIRAVDYSGAPVAGGVAELSISSPVPLRTLDGVKLEEPDDTIERRFKLDSRGELVLKGEFSAFQPGDNGHLCVSGSVANDREEHVRLPLLSEHLAAADFRPEFSVLGGRLTLIDTLDPSRPLARAQSVNMAIHYMAKEITRLPNGFVFMSAKRAILCEEDVLVPAGCREGVEWDALRMWDEFYAGLDEDREAGNPRLVVSATDSGGRIVSEEFDLGRRMDLYYRGLPEEKTESCRVGGDGMLHLTTTRPRAGKAGIVLMCQGECHVEMREVKEGAQEIVLPLPPGVEGEVRVVVHQPLPDASGVYTRCQPDCCTVEIPRTRYALQTELDVPSAAVRPGSTITLGGRVSKAGKGVPATVTLFAVDAGMLSLSRYKLKDLLHGLSGCSHSYGSFFHSLVVPGNFQSIPDSSMMPSIWDKFDFLDSDCLYACEADMADMGDRMFMRASMPRKCSSKSRREGRKMLSIGEVAECVDEDDLAAPRLRTNFQPVAVWCGALKTDADGRFSTEVTLPDTLTTYKVYALVLGDDACTFGNAEAEFTVNQPLMLTPGTPFFMSVGDTLRLPLSITNNSDEAGVWSVRISSSDTPQEVSLPARGSTTVHFDFTAVREGVVSLEWSAVGAGASDAVQGSFPVRFPAPLLKEVHRIVLPEGEEKKLADLLAPELAGSRFGEVEIHLSANPLLHLAGCMDYLLEYPYGCTEQTASGLLPWLFHDRLAAFCPRMSETPAATVHKVVAETIGKLFKRQKQDGGLGYWDDSRESCGWASAYAALVLTIAQEQGHGALIPQDKMEKLRGYLRGYGRKQEGWISGRQLDYALARALGVEPELEESRDPDMEFIRVLCQDPAKKHDAFLQWMRARALDSHHTTLRGGWRLIALHEYLRLTPASSLETKVRLQDGTTMVLNQGVTILKPQADPLSALPTVLKAVQGEVYVTFKAKAQPNQTEYPGVVEKGLQITRIYEKKGADGIWREAKEFVVGEVVRVTLTCAKSEPELKYFVLEDYLPSCMEAINPNVPSQAAGLEWSPWSYWFDHKEYLADRVRGFCTRWGGRDLLNMTYYARVKRAGTTMAPPAQAQIMYEPQTYGLSPNNRIQSK